MKQKQKWQLGVRFEGFMLAAANEASSLEPQAEMKSRLHFFNSHFF